MYIPMGSRVVIRRIKTEARKGPGDLLLPIISNESPPLARVEGVGREVTEVKVGDLVLVTRFKGQELGDDQWLIDISEILAVVDEKECLSGTCLP